MILIPILLIAALAALVIYHRAQFSAFYRRVPSDGLTVLVDGRRVFYRVTGSGPVVVVDTALGSPSAEWWALQDRLSDQFTVVTYDRAGYGWSDPAPAPRTPDQIAHELAAMLDAAGIREPVILVGHSQGGLNLRHFARLYPSRVAGAVFLDPLSPDDDQARSRLTPEQYAGSGFDKSASMRSLRIPAALGLLRLLKPLMVKSPPFFYYRGVTPAAVDAVWQHLNRPGLVETVMAEYALAHDPTINAPLKAAGSFPPVPLRVLFHERSVLVDEIMRYGGLAQADAEQVDQVWEDLVREYLTLSPDARWIAARGSHFLHMSDPEALIAALDAVASVGTPG